MNTVEEKKTCADLIAQELQERQNYLADLYSRADDGEDSAQEDIWDMAYGVSTYSVTRVIWSGGGPSDFIEITDCGGEIEKVEYVYQDWFDGARVTVETDSPVYRYAVDILEGMAQ